MAFLSQYTKKGNSEKIEEKRKTTDKHNIKSIHKKRRYNNIEHQQENKKNFLSFHTWCSKKRKKKNREISSLHFSSHLRWFFSFFPFQASCLYDMILFLLSYGSYNIQYFSIHTWWLWIDAEWGETFFIVLFHPLLECIHKSCVHIFVHSKNRKSSNARASRRSTRFLEFFVNFPLSFHFKIRL